MILGQNHGDVIVSVRVTSSHNSGIQQGKFSPKNLGNKNHGDVIEMVLWISSHMEMENATKTHSKPSGWHLEINAT